MLSIPRRNLFGGMSLLGLLAFAQTLWAHRVTGRWPDDYPSMPLAKEPKLRYKGYGIFWSGWLPSQFTARLYGHWKAWPLAEEGRQDGRRVILDLPYLYVMAPEAGMGPYKAGDWFDLEIRGIVVEKETPEEIKLREEQAGLKRLIALIDSRDWRGYKAEGTGVIIYDNGK